MVYKLRELLGVEKICDRAWENRPLFVISDF